MEYVDFLWTHGSDSDPVRIVSELDRNRLETRKLEFFASGKVGFASVDVTIGAAGLSDEPIPSPEEINRDPQFSACSITGHAFEELWKAHARHDV